MSDYNKTDIGTGYNSSAAVNTETTKIETAVNSKMDKSGGTFTGDIDLNSNEILNIANATTPQGAVAKSQLDSATFNTGAVVSLDTTSRLISEGRDVTLVVDTQGYHTSGDGGGAKWRYNGVSGQTVNQSPVQLGDALLNDANGNQWALILPSYLANAEINPEALGAVGDKSTDDLPALNVCMSYMNSRGGGIINLPKTYRITSTLSHTGKGVHLRGAGVKNIFNSTVSSSDNSVIYADFTSGPAVLVTDGDSRLSDFTIEGSSARRSASITTGVRNANSGVLIEPVDDSSDIIQNVTLTNMRVVSQPADGYIAEGDITNLEFNNCYSADTGRHGIVITEGTISGRTNTKQSGIINIVRGKSFDCGGHGLCIGHPSSTQFPYRVTVLNRESFRLATDAAQRYTTAGNWFVGQDSLIMNCALAGTTTGNTPDHEGISIGGRDTTLLNNRYINCQTNYVDIIQQSGFSTQNLKIDGGTCATTGATAPADFAALASGPDGIEIKRVQHDGANPIIDLTISATNDNVTLHDLDSNTTEHHNHTIDFTEATVTGLRIRGDELTISSGAVTVEKEGYHTVDTESDAASDTLDTISGGSVGDILVLQQDNSGRVVTLQHAGGGNIRLSGAVNFSFSSSVEFIQLIFTGTNWYQMTPSVDNS